MLKRLYSLLTALLLLVSFAPGSQALDPATYETSVEHVVLMEAATGRILYEKNADASAFPASTTKIMTCILALENGDLDEEITVGEEVWRGFGSQSSLMKLSEGEKITLRDLLYGLMLVSGNDAAAAIAVHLGGSISGFADMMNAKAAELGMTGSHFMNPHGTHKEESFNTVTARDMALLARYCLTQSPEAQNFRAIVSSRTHDVDPTNRDSDGYHLENTNKLVHTKEDKESFEYRGAIGIKTGDTNASLRCLVAAAERDGTTLIAVLLKDEPDDNRFKVAAELFDYGFENFRTVQADTLGLPTDLSVVVKNCSFDDSENGQLALEVDLTSLEVAGLADELARIQANPAAVVATVTPKGDLSAPVNEGDAVATVAYQFEGETILTAECFASRSIAAMASAALETPDGHALVDSRQGPEEESSPWLFWGLVVLGILIVVFVVRYFLRRNRRLRRRSRRRTRVYRRR